VRSRRGAFWAGASLVVAGVLLHVPDYVAARHQHFMMAGMPMGTAMSVGMILIIVGLIAGAWALLPGRASRRNASRAAARAPVTISALDELKLGRAHWSLIAALTVGLVVDTMKPATLGFVIPPMAAEYGISLKTASLLALVALTGTVAGSLAWGRLADVYGRRATILLSALIYIATSICGFMPSFGWNLLMCGLMGLAAGGMLPTVYSLASESIPARHRGWVLVVMSGAGATLGYLVASGAATLIEPILSWRALWLLGAPTGLILLALSRYVPESPRFLVMRGRQEEAERVTARFGLVTQPMTLAAPADPPPVPPPPAGFRTLFSARFLFRSLVVVLYGVGWSVVNWGFITFLPAYLSRAGMGATSNRLLFFASVISLPAIGLAGLLYVRWGGKRAMLAYAAAVGLVLGVFAAADPARPGGSHTFVTLTALLLAGSYGMIAMLSPYAAELYPTRLRGSGSGLAAAASKLGGIAGPLLLTSAPGIPALATWTLVPLTIGVAALWRLGPVVSRNSLDAPALVAEEPSRTS
jgi:putative MFS transporter